jgi:hypothetical protein
VRGRGRASLPRFFLVAPTSARAQAFGAPPGFEVVVNGAALSPDEIEALVAYYGEAYPGRYWYDRVSGLYGYEGGPPVGQGAPGVLIGGPLQAAW